MAQLVEEFLDQCVAEQNSVATLTARLRHVTGAFGTTRLDRLDPRAVAAWRKRLPEGSAWHVHKAFRQALHYAVRTKLADENVAAAVPNPEPKRREVASFETLADVEAVATELAPAQRPIPVFVALTGLRGHRTPYSLRHTYAAWMIAAGVSLFDLSRLMGTSVEQLDKTYGHLLRDSLDRARTALDAYVGDAERTAASDQ